MDTPPTPGPPPADPGSPDPAQDGRIQKGTDPDDPRAGLLAAAAATSAPLNEAAYRRFVADSDEHWPTVHDLVKRYGSFNAALQAAGIRQDDLA